MFSVVATATQMELELVVRAVLAHLDASAILLFGSQARGDSHPGSDMDLLIVAGKDALGGRPGYEVLGQIYRELSVLPMGVDLLLYTPQEVQARRNSLNHVIARALREGRLLHGHV
jgi:predicted nucleotidyltransferase